MSAKKALDLFDACDTTTIRMPVFDRRHARLLARVEKIKETCAVLSVSEEKGAAETMHAMRTLRAELEFRIRGFEIEWNAATTYEAGVAIYFEENETTELPIFHLLEYDTYPDRFCDWFGCDQRPLVPVWPTTMELDTEEEYRTMCLLLNEATL